MDERRYEQQCYEEDETEISLLDILLILAEGKKIIISCIMVFLLAGLGYALFINKPQYASTMQIVAMTQDSPKVGDFNVYVDGNVIVGILESDAVLDSVIDKNDLLKAEDGNELSRVSVRNKLGDAIDTQLDAYNGIVRVTVRDASPEKARNIALSIYDTSLARLEEMGVILAIQKDAYIQTEIEKSIEKIQKFKEEANLTSVNKNIDERLKTLFLFALYKEGSVYRKSVPTVIYLMSPPSLPDQPMPRGRGKIIAISTILGLFLGIMVAFIIHFMRFSASGSATEYKMNRLKELACIKRKIVD